MDLTSKEADVLILSAFEGIHSFCPLRCPHYVMDAQQNPWLTVDIPIFPLVQLYEKRMDASSKALASITAHLVSRIEDKKQRN